MIRPADLLHRLTVLIIVLSCRSPVAFAEINAADPEWIRVAIAQDQSEVDLAIHGRYRIMALQTSEPLGEGSRLPRAAVRARPEGIVVGEQLFPLFGVRIEPARDAAIKLNGQRVRGTVEILRQQDLSLLVINHVGLEDYLRGVLSKEAPHDWPIEALRALAIAARTYALFQRLSKASVDYDVSGDVLSQLYGGKTAERTRTNRAVKDTQGLILLYHDQVFPTFYHSTCGGLTEHASVMGPFDLEPLNGSIPCSFCVGSPFYRWQRRLTKADVAWAVTQQGRGSIWPVEDLEVIERTQTGRVAKVRIRGASRTLILTGYEFRQLFGFERIRSTAFAIIPDGEAFILQGHGWGHGVGLCQWGAAELAQRGLSAREILAFYYPGAGLARLGEIPLQPIPVKDVEP